MRKFFRPEILKKRLLTGIAHEITVHSEKKPGLIQFKMNALEDADIARALYQASRAGVTVDLIVAIPAGCVPAYRAFPRISG